MSIQPNTNFSSAFTEKRFFLPFLCLFTLVAASCERDWKSICADHGAPLNKNGDGCVCEIYDSQGRCKSQPMAETFVHLREDAERIVIQRRGTGAKVSFGSKLMEDAIIADQDGFDAIILSSKNIAISIPDYPEKVAEPWVFENCLFEKISEDQIDIKPRKRSYIFKSSCSKTPQNIYIVNEYLALDGFAYWTDENSLKNINKDDFYWNLSLPKQ